MAKLESIVDAMWRNPKNIRFRDLCRVCDNHFGSERMSVSSHRVYNKPWGGDPRVNIQALKGMAKEYQVRQVLRAIDKLKNWRLKNESA